MGVVIAELALVLAAIGALAQFPGLKWLINEEAPSLCKALEMRLDLLSAASSVDS